MENIESNLNIDWLKNNCYMIHYFGLGFIQLKLIDLKYRLHFYSKDLPPILGEEDVHNHRYNFKSKVLKGSFEQDFFRVLPGDTHIKYFESCTPDRGDTNESECRIEFNSTLNLVKGELYFIHHTEFHRVRANDAITLVERGTRRKPLAEVIRLKGSEFICPFSKVIPDSELWEIVEKSLKDLK